MTSFDPSEGIKLCASPLWSPLRSPLWPWPPAPPPPTRLKKLRPLKPLLKPRLPTPPWLRLLTPLPPRPPTPPWPRLLTLPPLLPPRLPIASISSMKTMHGLAARASGTDAQDLILGALAGSGPLPGEVGTYFGGLGVDATEALVRAAPGGLGAIKDAGYELHRDPKVWADASARSVTWPAAARAALLAGGAEHAARFGGAPPQES